MVNTISSRTYRDNLRKKTFQEILKLYCVSENIFEVDRSGDKVIQNPYSSVPTVTDQAISGSYTVADFTTTDESLTVDRELIVAEHIRDFESLLTNPDLFMDRTMKTGVKLKEKLDARNLSGAVTAANTAGNTITVAGGFTSANVVSTLSQVYGKFVGYMNELQGMYLVIADTDVPAFIQATSNIGFVRADQALENGLLTKYMNIEIYVVKASQLPANKRLCGIKKASTYAFPQDWKVEEKYVSGKTGKEVATYGYTGYKHWTNSLPLTYEINVA